MDKLRVSLRRLYMYGIWNVGLPMQEMCGGCSGKVGIFLSDLNNLATMFVLRIRVDPKQNHPQLNTIKSNCLLSGIDYHRLEVSLSTDPRNYKKTCLWK